MSTYFAGRPPYEQETQLWNNGTVRWSRFGPNIVIDAQATDNAETCATRMVFINSHLRVSTLVGVLADHDMSERGRSQGVVYKALQLLHLQKIRKGVGCKGFNS